jgi:predicted transcriptional regulator
MDQGATQALPIYRTRDRLLSGRVEVILKQHVADKTAWQRMLKGEPDAIDLADRRNHLQKECEKEIREVVMEEGEDAVTFLANEQLIDINYPVEQYPEKVKSFNFDKVTEVAGSLMGIKGQYLILDTGVLNIRKFSGYKLTLNF